MKSEPLTESFPNDRPIVFFDGVCGLCNRSVDWLLARDKKNNAFLFAPLQGETARLTLATQFVVNPSTIIVWHNGRSLAKSEAVIYICHYLSWPYTWLGKLLNVFPLTITNKAYDRLAAKRYAWFGKKETCRLPSPEERSKFLP
ncbi:MAG: DUF393 domain-containing protein [Bacteroidetes bacterium]|jgi:predicted DCC family thiol-disulfide oxidoreductase YuxK|nr:DUF393 domain-containing protein [Bacteroidota bacterium]